VRERQSISDELPSWTLEPQCADWLTEVELGAYDHVQAHVRALGMLIEARQLEGWDPQEVGPMHPAWPGRPSTPPPPPDLVAAARDAYARRNDAYRTVSPGSDFTARPHA
jgi:hypothetical protein